MERQSWRKLDRRRFLAASAAGLAGAVLAAGGGVAAESKSTVSFGLVTDVHYAGIPPAGDRHYRDSEAKLREAVDTFNRRKVDFVAELGDFCDAGPSTNDDLEYLATIRRVFERFQGPRHYVLGNHCVLRLTKEEFLGHCGASVRESYYSFDRGPYHFVVLDADFRPDETPYAAGNFKWTESWIPAAELRWLAEDLRKAAGRPSIVFVHQNLHDERQSTGVKNAPAVRRVLESAGNVKAVFQGHEHAGGHAQIHGIHYCTLRAMVVGPGVENRAYAIVTLDADRFRFEPFGRERLNPW